MRREDLELGEDPVDERAEARGSDLLVDVPEDVVDGEVGADAVADLPLRGFDAFTERDDFSCHVRARDDVLWARSDVLSLGDDQVTELHDITRRQGFFGFLSVTSPQRERERENRERGVSSSDVRSMRPRAL